MPAEENMALVRRLYDAQTKGDLHAMRSCSPPDFDNHWMAPGQEDPAARATFGALPWFMLPSPISATSSRSRWRPKATGW